jgi:hypothetical protein
VYARKLLPPVVLKYGLVSPFIVTSTVVKPSIPAGVTQRASLEDTTVAVAIIDAPKRHAMRPGTKPAPDKVTTVPPEDRPLEG